jgi:hypothetical protein
MRFAIAVLMLLALGACQTPGLYPGNVPVHLGVPDE